MITQKELKELLHYDPDTGDFTWMVKPCSRILVGYIAGTTNKYGYVRIGINKKIYPAHWLAWLYMTGEWPEYQIDHEDHVRDNNRWLNLRKATHIENCKNRSLDKRNISGVAGVIWDKSRGLWSAELGSNSKKIFLGRYGDIFEAYCARLSANNKYGFHENHGR